MPATEGPAFARQAAIGRIKGRTRSTSSSVTFTGTGFSECRGKRAGRAQVSRFDIKNAGCTWRRTIRCMGVSLAHLLGSAHVPAMMFLFGCRCLRGVSQREQCHREGENSVDLTQAPVYCGVRCTTGNCTLSKRGHRGLGGGVAL